MVVKTHMLPILKRSLADVLPSSQLSRRQPQLPEKQSQRTALPVMKEQNSFNLKKKMKFNTKARAVLFIHSAPAKRTNLVSKKWTSVFFIRSPTSRRQQQSCQDKIVSSLGGREERNDWQQDLLGADGNWERTARRKKESERGFAYRTKWRGDLMYRDCGWQLS